MPVATATLVQQTIALFPASGGTNSVSMLGVTNGDILLMGIATGFSTISTLVTTSGSTGSWTLLGTELASSLDVEWWYAHATGSGSVAALATSVSGTNAPGIWLGEMSNGTAGISPGVPVLGTSNSGSSTTVGCAAQTVSVPNSFVGVMDLQINSSQVNSTGLGNFSSPITFSGSAFSGVTYRNTSANTSAVTGWTATTGAWVSLGIIVPPIPISPKPYVISQAVTRASFR